MTFDINWLGSLIAVVATIALGGVYFGALVARPYLAVLGRTEAPRPDAVRAVGPVVCNVVTVLATAVLVASIGLVTFGGAILLGLVVGIGLQVAMTFQIALNPNFPHPIRYGLLNTPYFVLSALVTSVLLVLV